MYPDYNNKEHRDCIRRNLSNCGSGVIDEACEMIDALEAKVRELEATLAACKKAGFIDENGNVRKVLGTLPVTADGCLLGLNGNVYTEDITQAGRPIVGAGSVELKYEDVTESWNGIAVRTQNGDEFDTWTDKVFSTPEAAEKARRDEEAK